MRLPWVSSFLTWDDLLSPCEGNKNEMGKTIVSKRERKMFLPFPMAPTAGLNNNQNKF